MNHCSVARKITGIWQRQQCGYECASFSMPSSAPVSCKSSITMGLPYHTVLPISSSEDSRRPFGAGKIAPPRPPDSTSQCRTSADGVVFLSCPVRVHRAPRALFQLHVVGNMPTESRSSSGWRKTAPSRSARPETSRSSVLVPAQLLRRHPHQVPLPPDRPRPATSTARIRTAGCKRSPCSPGWSTV